MGTSLGGGSLAQFWIPNFELLVTCNSRGQERRQTGDIHVEVSSILRVTTDSQEKRLTLKLWCSSKIFSIILFQ